MSRRDDVLAALRGAPGGVSGERIAAELGISRVAVGKHVSALRDQGYGIDATPGSGYVLRTLPDAPLPAEVTPLLGDRRWTLQGGGPTGSTNDDVKALASAGAPEYTVMLASAQTGGRGRLGRTWTSPEGGLYLSVLLRPALEPARVAPLSLVVALGVARGLARLGVEPLLKWPNDVRIGTEKLAGVLLEIAAESDRVSWVVAGIGVNVHATVGREPGGAYLADELPGVTLPSVAAAVLDGLAEALDAFTADGFAALATEYSARSALTGESVTVRDLVGGVIASGVAEGVDSEGRLLVRDGERVVPVFAGEVTLR